MNERERMANAEASLSLPSIDAGPRLPSIGQIQEIAADFGLDMPEADAASYQNLMRGLVKSYRRLERYPEMRPPVTYPRTPGYRPSPEENPFNAWYWKTHIEGAESGPLKGVRVGVKDAICVAGEPMMNGSRLLEGFIPDVDATVVTRLLDAGAIIAGKTSTPDCSLSGGGHTNGIGTVRNPRKPTHSPGGSSNGSAAALVCGDVEMTLGGDQGGSIRVPAAWCGVVGHKPTYGLVPYTGCMMIEMTLDYAGPMANTVENVARMLSVIAGPDPLDPRQRGRIPADYVRDYTPAIGQGAQGLKIAVLKEGFSSPDWEDVGLPRGEEVVDRKVKATIRELEKRGATVTEVSVPMHIEGIAIFMAIFTEGGAEFMVKGNGAGTNWEGFYNGRLSEAFARGWRSRPNDLPVSLKSMFLAGEYMHRYYHGRYYAKGQNLRPMLRQAYDDVLGEYDVLVMPTVPYRATPIPAPDCSIEESVFNSMCAIHNTPQFNVTGHPAISVPCGMEDGLPIGLMIVGKHFDDLTVLRVADAVEKIGDWKTM